MSIFDDMAATWDDQPDRVERTRVVAQRLKQVIDFDRVKAGLEYGAGTGQLSFALADVLPHCLLMDTSVEMLKAADRGIVERSLPWDTERRNFATQAADHPVGITDVIYSLQVMHHVDDLSLTVTNMSRALTAGGQLALIDLPAGSHGFHHGGGHSHEENPHLNGIGKQELEEVLVKTGFKDVRWHDDIELVRHSEGGPQPYTLFLVTAHT